MAMGMTMETLGAFESDEFVRGSEDVRLVEDGKQEPVLLLARE